MDMATICADLQAELEDLDVLLRGLDEADWQRPTPATDWMVRDQISHIGLSDRFATVAAAEPERFQADLLTQDLREHMARQQQQGRAMRSADLLAWWQTGYAAMLKVFLRLDPKARIPWVGPAMSAVSFATARLMETWAHGQDIVDALGRQRPGTERLRHVAHIGVRARPFSFRMHAQEPPAENIRVELISPAGARWTWGDAEARQVVQGTALDFCLVVAQRRHLMDTDLHLTGAAAEAWMCIAQAFAGPPGPGRQPGQFPKHSGVAVRHRYSRVPL
ncbi:hypothetical protein NKDENANG_01884 [Candidatus Entotheonellaceae bacterium PAL068K]